MKFSQGIALVLVSFSLLTSSSLVSASRQNARVVTQSEMDQARRAVSSRTKEMRKVVLPKEPSVSPVCIAKVLESQEKLSKAILFCMTPGKTKGTTPYYKLELAGVGGAIEHCQKEYGTTDLNLCYEKAYDAQAVYCNTQHLNVETELAALDAKAKSCGEIGLACLNKKQAHKEYEEAKVKADELSKKAQEANNKVIAMSFSGIGSFLQKDPCSTEVSK